MGPLTARRAQVAGLLSIGGLAALLSVRLRIARL
jgi:hypothetical protein